MPAAKGSARTPLGPTKAIMFNQARNNDFQPAISIDGEQLEVVEEIKLLGVVLRSDLRWSSNTVTICVVMHLHASGCYAG